MILSAYFPLLLQVWQLAVLSVAVGMPEATDGYSVHPVVAGSTARVGVKWKDAQREDYIYKCCDCTVVCAL